jgi:hypothetical protein
LLTGLLAFDFVRNILRDDKANAAGLFAFDE